MADTGERMEGVRRTLEQQVDQLPTLPAASRRLLAIDPTSNEYFDAALAVVEADPGIALRVLGLANSAASSPTNQITSARAALARLGGAAVNRLILTATVARQLGGAGPEAAAMWYHALLVGGLARRLHPRLVDPRGSTADDAYTAGLLHDLGHFVVYFADVSEISSLHERDWKSPEGLIETERHDFGLAHTDLGYLACRRWELPDLIAEVVLTHHDDPTPMLDATSTLRELVRFSDQAVFPWIREIAPGTDDGLSAVIADELARDVPDGLNVDAGTLADEVAAVVGEAHTTLRVLSLA